MSHKVFSRQFGLLAICFLFYLAPASVLAQDDTIVNEDELLIEGDSVALEVDIVDNKEVASTDSVVVPLIGNAEIGKALFQGEKRFLNNGPTCVSCHNVQAEGVIPGGLFAKDLTDVYERLGEGLVGWLMAPPFPAMAASYTDYPLTEQERTDLTAFFKMVNENKSDTATADNGSTLFYYGGGLGLFAILFLVQVLWMKRKKQMTKKDIFARQSKAWDAKF